MASDLKYLLHADYHVTVKFSSASCPLWLRYGGAVSPIDTAFVALRERDTAGTHTTTLRWCNRSEIFCLRLLNRRSG